MRRPRQGLRGCRNSAGQAAAPSIPYADADILPVVFPDVTLNLDIALGYLAHMSESLCYVAFPLPSGLFGRVRGKNRSEEMGVSGVKGSKTYQNRSPRVASVPNLPIPSHTLIE